MSDPVRRIDEMLAALRPGQTPAAWAAPPDGRAWHDFTVRAIVMGLAPILAHQLCDVWSWPVPPAEAAKLRAVRDKNAARNAEIFAQLEAVLAACQREGLAPIALKGVHLAAAYYDQPALRPMNDIDLLFQPAELPRVGQLLRELDYAGKEKSAKQGPGIRKHSSTFRRHGGDAPTPNPFLSTGADRTIEPHGSLEESWFGLRVDVTPGVRARAATAVIGSRDVRVLAPDDLLLHLAVHFCFHLIQGAPAMIQFVDLLVVSQSGHVNWEAFAARAAERRAAPYAFAALGLADRLLGAPVPDGTLATLASATPQALRRRLATLGLPDLLQRTQQKPLGGVADRLQRGLRDRAETARWAPSRADRWRVWRTALHPLRTDTGRLLLRRN